MAALWALRHARKICGCNLQITAPSSSCLRLISSSNNLRGLEEFFPAGVYESGGPAPKEVRAGRRWHASDLRQKSNTDLHKLWYVLLKEMNMLLTVREEAKRLQMPMPNPERIVKVRKSMAMIKVVVGERELAVQKLADMGYQSQFKEVASPLLQGQLQEDIDSREATNDSRGSIDDISSDISSRAHKNDLVDKDKT